MPWSGSFAVSTGELWLWTTPATCFTPRAATTPAATIVIARPVLKQSMRDALAKPRASSVEEIASSHSLHWDHRALVLLIPRQRRVGSGRVGLVHARRQSCASAFMVSIAKLPIPHRHAGRSDARLRTTATQEPDVLPLSDAGAGTHASPTAAGGRVGTGSQATGRCRHQGWLGSVPRRRAPSSCVPFRPPFASSCKHGSAPPSWPRTAPCRLPGSTPSAAPW